MNDSRNVGSERALVLAPHGRDAVVAAGILNEANLAASICVSLRVLLDEIELGAGVVIVTEEAVRTADIKGLAAWIGAQPPWSDLPFVLITERGAGVERNPTARRQMEALGNVAFLERPFHPTTLISVVGTALRGRRRQYEARERLLALHESERHARRAERNLRALNETLEAQVAERTAELAAANRQLVAQIEERERVEVTLRQMQRLEAVGQLTSGVAHDFNNLLTVVLGNIGFIERSTAVEGKLRDRLGHMRMAAERGAQLTSQLLAFSRRQRLDPKSVDLSESLASMRDLLQSTMGGSVQIRTELRPGLWHALADPTQIELVVLNLVINARDAMPRGGSVTLETANVTLGPPASAEEPSAGDYVLVSVTDEGLGMSKDVLAKAFEPFFTTKEVGKGSGLGLSQVLGFAKQSGGGVQIETRVGEGTVVKVYLPRALTPLTPAAAAVTPPVRHSGKRAVILLVDDDNAVREVTASLLRELGYAVLEAGSGAAALNVLNGQVSLDLAVLDFAMPGMNGAEVAYQMRTKMPALPILFVTGYADKAALHDIADGRIIKKPFVGDELARKVQDALAGSGSTDVRSADSDLDGAPRVGPTLRSFDPVDRGTVTGTSRLASPVPSPSQPAQPRR